MSDTPENPEDVQPEADEVAEVETFDITTATEEQLREREAALQAKITELAAQPKTLDNVTARNALRLERNAVVEAVNALSTLDTELDDVQLPAISDPAAEAEVADTPQEELVADDIPTPEAVEAPEAELVEAAEGVLAEAHVASAERPVAPAARTRPRVAHVAGAGQSAFTQGVELDGYEALAQAWESRRTQLRPGPTGEPMRAVVAGLPSFESMKDELGIELLERNNPATRNDALIAESVAAWRAKRSGAAMDAHTAAICEPLDIIREIPTDGVTDVPFGNLFPQRPIGRLGFQFTRASAISVAASGVDIWTDTDQDAIDPDNSATWKPTVLIDCTAPTSVTAEELTTSAIVDTSTEMSSPERVAEFMFKLAVARARRREQYLLTAFDATAANYTLTATYGAMSGLVQAVHTLLPQLLYAERLPETDYDLVLDPGFLNKLAIDLYNQGHREAQEAALQVIQRQVGLNVTVLHDFVGASSFQTVPAAGGGADALTALPSANRVRLVPAGAYIFGATGEESTGWQTDPQLARQNRMQAFSAEWLMLAKHGTHPAAYVDITSTATGYLGGTKAMP